MTNVNRTLLVLGILLSGLAMAVAVLALGEKGSATAVAASESVSVAEVGPTCEGENLLVNPGFEGDYEPYIYPAPGHPDCQTWDVTMPNQYCQRAKMPVGWHPRWLPDGTREFLIMPEYTDSTPDQVNPDRVRSGGKSLHYWSFWTMHEAVALQQVTAVSGVDYCFSAWGHAWSDRLDDDWYSATPDRPIDDGQVFQRVGVDPTGGTDWQSPNVIWSDERKQYDLFGEFAISATAQADTITVFVYSRADNPVKHNDVYWDDAVLTALTPTFSAAAGGSLGLMATITTPMTVTAAIPIQISNPGYTWTAVLDPQATYTPTLSATSGGASDVLTVTLTSQGLLTGTYTSTLTIASAQPAIGSPVTVPIAVHVVDRIFPAYLPIVTKP